MSSDGDSSLTSCVDTYWGRSVYEGPPPWRLNWDTGGGYFAISAKSFSAGDRILLEHPTTWTQAWHPFSESDMVAIEIGVEALSPDEKSAFYAMSNMYPEVTPTSAGIYMTNSFDMPDYADADAEETQHASGMFLAIGRLNHSCLPNAQQTYIPKENDPSPPGRANESTGYEVLYATREIKEGEELSDCYIELRQSTELRRKELLKHYRFLCTCHACGPPDDVISPEQIKERKENDARRIRALKLEQDMTTFAEMGEIEMATDLGVELVKLLEHPKSTGWGERYIAEACVNTCTLYQEQNQLRVALQYLEKAHTWNVKLQGEKSADSVATAKKIADLKASMLGKKKK
eukprot:gene12452-14406_t